MLRDAHCHLRADATNNTDSFLREESLAGVCSWVSCSTRPEDWDAQASLAANRQHVGSAFGIHPRFIHTLNVHSTQKLERLLKHHHGAAVGEIGLDYRDGYPGRDSQREGLRVQIDLAKRIQRPFILHAVHAWGDLLAILDNTAPHRAAFMVHGFAGSKETMKAIIELNGFVSFGPGIIDPRHRRAREAAAHVPLERCLIETDHDTPHSGGPRLHDVLNALGDLRAEDRTTIAETTGNNASQLFTTGTSATVTQENYHE